jgi:hypothetical protein
VSIRGFGPAPPWRLLNCCLGDVLKSLNNAEDLMRLVTSDFFIIPSFLLNNQHRLPPVEPSSYLATMSHDRTLRVLTLFTTALATPLLIASTVVSLQLHSWHRRRVSAFCFGYIPLALTAAVSVIGIARHGRTPRLSIALLDLAAAVTYVALLIPIWSVEVPRLNQGGVGLLIGYTTAPMIVNM